MGKATVLAVLAMCTPVVPAPAQVSASLSGIVRDSLTGRPIGGAIVEVLDAGASVTTKADGTFSVTVDAPGQYTVNVRGIGYYEALLAWTVGPDRPATNRIEVTLAPVPVELRELVAEAEGLRLLRSVAQGFVGRRRAGYGRFLTRPEIARSGAVDLASLLRRFPETSVVRESALGEPFIWMGCPSGGPPDVYLDGVRVPAETLLFPHVPIDRIEAIEVYRANRLGGSPAALIPPDFWPTACGIIALWTANPIVVPRDRTKPIFSIMLGFSVPSSPDKLTDSWQRGANIGVGIGYPLSPSVTLQALVEYSRFGLDQDRFFERFELGGPVGVYGGAVESLNLSADLRATLAISRWPVAPFLIGEVGFLKSSTEVPVFFGALETVLMAERLLLGTSYGPGKRGERMVDGSGLSVGFGAGVDIVVTRRLGVFIGGKYVRGVTAGVGNTAYFPIAIGMQFR